MPGLFVTGTDTGVGKTVVTAALLAALRRRGADVAAYKPCETGVDDPAAWPPDGRFLAAAAGTGESLDRTVPVRLRAPAAPLVAAANEGRHLDPAALVAGYHRLARDHAIVLAEGAGGLAVPLAPGWDTARLAAACGLPLLVVARSTLGTLNHCALTVAYARLRRLPVLAICLNRFDATGELAETTAPTVLAHWLGLPVVTFPSLPGLDVDAGPTDEILAALAAQAEATFDIDALVAQIREVTP